MRISDWSSDVCSSDLSSGHRYVQKKEESGSERAGKDAVVVELAPDVEPARADVGETLLAIEGERPIIAGIDAEEQAAMTLGRGNGPLHQRGAKAGAVEARQRIDALELDIALRRGGEIGFGNQRETDRRAARQRLGEPRSRA